MNIIEIIEKKKNGQVLSKDELKYAVMEYVNGNIPDYQMSALLMAIVIRGMEEQEIVDLTDVMIDSGDRLDLSAIKGTKVDKHSTGGIGDKTTLAVLPLVASCGVKCAKMSGRGLGITGGTIDKLESIPGFQTKLTFSEFIQEVNQIGMALTSQTGNLCPADKKIYALRDVTGTTESIPLIASSIMSKKIASGADKIVIDVKVGHGALMKTLEDARKLAHTMIHIGKKYQKDTICILSNMEQPLGFAIGNRLEVEEAISFLKGEPSAPDFQELVLALATYMVHLGLDIPISEAEKKVKENLQNGRGYQKFLEFVSAQHGTLPQTNHLPERKIYAKTSGYIQQVHADQLGSIVKELGGGRERVEDQIDYEVGIILNKKRGDFVREGELLMTVYENQKKLEEQTYLNCFSIAPQEGSKQPIIYEMMVS